MELRSIAWLVISAAACSAPLGPTLPTREEVGQPADEARGCDPPYPMNFGNRWYAFADLDAGRSCNVFLEEDQCILAIFRDCPMPNATVAREWQGRSVTSGTDRHLTLRPLFPSGASKPARTPNCCAASLLMDAAGHFSASFNCSMRGCNNLDMPSDLTGLMMEERDTTIDPAARLGGSPLAFAGGGEGVTELYTVPGDNAVYALVDRAGQMTGDGLYRLPTMGAGPMPLINPASPDPFRVAVGPGAIYMATGARIYRRAVPSGTDSSVDLPATVDALAVTPNGVLLAMYGGGMATLSLRDLVTLAETASGAAANRIAELAPLGHPSTIAIASFAGVPGLARIAPDLSAIERMTAQTPTHLLAIGATTVGYVGACYTGPGSPDCWYEESYDAMKTDRTGVPDTGEVAAVAYSASEDRVYLSSRAGPVTILDRAPLRPRLQHRLPFSDPTGPIAVDETGKLYVAQPTLNAIARVTPDTP